MAHKDFHVIFSTDTEEFSSLLAKNEEFKVRTDIYTEDQFKCFYKLATAGANVKFHRYFKNPHVEQYVYSESFVCHHSGHRSTKKDLQCPVKLTVRIKKDNYRARCSDKLITNYPCFISLLGHHSHEIQRIQSVPQLKTLSQAKELYHELFKQVMEPKEASPQMKSTMSPPRVDIDIRAQSSITMNTECMNCCAEVTRATEFMYFDLLNPDNPSLTPVSRYIPAPQALNYIYKVSGKSIQIESGSGGSVDGQLGLCHPCWTIVSQLFLLHKELIALTKLNSLVNKTFQVLEQTNPHSNCTVAKLVAIDSDSSNSEDLPLQPELHWDNDTVDETVTILDSPESSPAPAAAVNAANKVGARKCVNNPDTPPLKKRAIDSNSSLDKQRPQTAPLVNIRNSLGIRLGLNNVTHPKPSPKHGPILRCTPKALTVNPNLSQPMSALQMATGHTNLNIDSVSPISVTNPQNCVPTCASQLYKTQKGSLVTPEKSKSVSSFNSSALFSRRILTGLPNATGSCNTGCGPVSGNRRKQQLAVRTSTEANPDQEHVSTKLDSSSLNPASNFPLILSVFESLSKRSSKPKGIPRKRDGKRPRTRTAETLSTCPECGRVFKWAESLRLHIKVHHEKKSKFICPVCEKPLMSTRLVRGHLETHRNPEERAQEKAQKALENPPNSNPGFLCPECGKTLASSCALKNHEKTHLPTRQLFPCKEPNCSFSTFTVYQLKSHTERMHRTYFKFQCSRCSQKFRLGSEFKNHQGFCCDPTERPHLCVNCGKRFKLKQHLELHYHEVHKMSKEEARALVYPGLPLPSWPDRTQKSSTKRQSSKKARKAGTSAPAEIPTDTSPFFIDCREDKVYQQL